MEEYIVKGWQAPYVSGEPYEFTYEDNIANCIVNGYRCFRGRCEGNVIWVADRDTHNDYHNHQDAGLPNPYADISNWIKR